MGRHRKAPVGAVVEGEVECLVAEAVEGHDVAEFEVDKDEGVVGLICRVVEGRNEEILKVEFRVVGDEVRERMVMGATMRSRHTQVKPQHGDGIRVLELLVLFDFLKGVRGLFVYLLSRKMKHFLNIYKI